MFSFIFLPCLIGTFLYFYPELRSILLTAGLTTAVSSIRTWSIINKYALLSFLTLKSRTHRETAYDYISFSLRHFLMDQLNIDASKIKHVSKKTAEISYYSGTKKYNLRMPKRRGPRKIISVITMTDDSRDDITEEILTFLGPSHDFHSIPTTPRMLGYDNLFVIYRGKAEGVRYESNDIVQV